MKLRILAAIAAAALLGGCATYDYSGSSDGYYYGRPSVQYSAPYGYYGGYYGYGARGYYGYPAYGAWPGYYRYPYRVYPSRPYYVDKDRRGGDRHDHRDDRGDNDHHDGRERHDGRPHDGRDGHAGRPGGDWRHGPDSRVGDGGRHDRRYDGGRRDVQPRTWRAAPAVAGPALNGPRPAQALRQPVSPAAPAPRAAVRAERPRSTSPMPSQNRVRIQTIEP